MGSELSCTQGKRGEGGGTGGDENERTRSLPLSPSSRPSIFFLCVNFFPALCYLNAWNRLVEGIWEGGGVLLTILGSPDPIFRPKNVAIGIFLFLSYSFE